MPQKIENGHLYYPLKSEFFIEQELRHISDKNYYGVFSKELVKKGQMVLKASGQCYSDIKDSEILQKYSVVLAPNLYLCPADLNNIENEYYLNHSCRPNLQRIGLLAYMAVRDIEINEELTLNYSPLDASTDTLTGAGTSEMVCLCGEENCRQVITSKDWQDPKLAKEFWMQWSPHIQKAILSLGETQGMI